MKDFLARPTQSDGPCLRLDATYIKVRQAGWIVSVAMMIVVAVK